MQLQIEIPDALAAVVKAQAEAQGVTPDDFVSRVLACTLGSREAGKSNLQPLETGYGMLAKYGPAPTAEEIDENRRDMFRNFAQGF